MGENELGSLLRAMIAVLVFAVIVAFFVGVIYIIFKLSQDIHSSSYNVN